MPILGLDIGGTKTAVVMAAADGRIHARHVFPTAPARGFETFLEEAVSASRAVIAEAAVTPDCASLCAGGPMDERRGVLIAPPHLAPWRNIPLTERVGAALGMPAFLMHDARAGAWAEWTFGAGREPGVRSLGFLTFATGFGFGIVLDGQLLDIPGEVGHWRVAESGPELFGKHGSLEGLASGAGIAMQAAATGRFPAGITAEQLADRARAGDETALSIFHSAAAQAGLQCARLADLFALDVVALGTIAIRSAGLVMETITDTFRREALPHLAGHCRVMPSPLGERRGDLASLSAALHAGYREDAPPGPALTHQLRTLRAIAGEALNDREFLANVDAAIQAVLGALANGRKVLTCGNGGSAADAAHLAEELVGRYRGNRPSLPAINLGADGSVLTCIANDFGFEEVFARQVEGLGQPGDVLVAFTTSGRSENLNRALRRATERGLVTIALTGKDGGESRQLAGIAIHIPHGQSERIQELHTFVLHAICEAVEARFGTAHG